MDTLWKSVPLAPDASMVAAATTRLMHLGVAVSEAVVREALVSAIASAPAEPVAFHMEVTVTDRNGTYRAVPRAGAGTEAAGLKGQRASYFGGRESAIYRLLGKSSRRLDVDGATITPMLPEAGDRIDVTRYSVIVGKRSA